MDSALIVSYSEKTANSLAQILAEASVNRITTLSNAAQARRVLIDNDFDLCIVNAPLPDEPGRALPAILPRQGFAKLSCWLRPSIMMTLPAGLKITVS